MLVPCKSDNTTENDSPLSLNSAETGFAHVTERWVSRPVRLTTLSYDRTFKATVSLFPVPSRSAQCSKTFSNSNPENRFLRVLTVSFIFSKNKCF